MNSKVRCNYCGRNSGDSLKFYKHANKLHVEAISKDWLPCNNCELLIPSEDELRIHSEKDHSQLADKSNERVKCQFCSDTLCSIQQYYKHVNKAHIELIHNKWYCCEACGFYLPSNMALTNHKGKAHINKQNPSKRLQCIYCSESICSPQQYYKHANKEHRDAIAKTWHMCPTCLFYLPTAEAVTKHSGKAHQAKHPNQNTERVTCTFCTDSLCSVQQYYKHANKDHMNEVSSKWHMCSVCNFFLPTVVALTNHKGKAHAPLKGPSKKFACSFCSEVSKSSDEHLAHANSHHKEEIAEKWQIHCKFCKFYFPTSLALKRHKEQYHTNSKGAAPLEEEKLTYFPEVAVGEIEVSTSEGP